MIQLALAAVAAVATCQWLAVPVQVLHWHCAAATRGKFAVLAVAEAKAAQWAAAPVLAATKTLTAPGITIAVFVFVYTIAIADQLLQKFAWTIQDQHRVAAALNRLHKLNVVVGQANAVHGACGKAEMAALAV
jgi:hypothetical protein